VNEWAIGSGVADVLTRDIRRFGGLGVESGGLVLRSAGADLADVLALLGDDGIVREPDYLEIGGAAMGTLFDWAEAEGLELVAQIHSHLFGKEMSPTDQRFSLTVNGFVSAIVPQAATAQSQPTAWGWWRFGPTRWRPIAAPAVVTRAARTVIVDGRGVVDG